MSVVGGFKHPAPAGYPGNQRPEVVSPLGYREQPSASSSPRRSGRSPRSHSRRSRSGSRGGRRHRSRSGASSHGSRRSRSRSHSPSRRHHASSPQSQHSPHRHSSSHSPPGSDGYQYHKGPEHGRDARDPRAPSDDRYPLFDQRDRAPEDRFQTGGVNGGGSQSGSVDPFDRSAQNGRNMVRGSFRLEGVDYSKYEGLKGQPDLQRMFTTALRDDLISEGGNGMTRGDILLRLSPGPIRTVVLDYNGAGGGGSGRRQRSPQPPSLVDAEWSMDVEYAISTRSEVAQRNIAHALYDTLASCQMHLKSTKGAYIRCVHPEADPYKICAVHCSNPAPSGEAYPARQPNSPPGGAVHPYHQSSSPPRGYCSPPGPVYDSFSNGGSGYAGPKMAHNHNVSYDSPAKQHGVYSPHSVHSQHSPHSAHSTHSGPSYYASTSPAVGRISPPRSTRY